VLAAGTAAARDVADRRLMSEVWRLSVVAIPDVMREPKKRAWRHGRAWKMKIGARKNQDPCFNFYKHIYALLHKCPV